MISDQEPALLGTRMFESSFQPSTKEKKTKISTFGSFQKTCSSQGEHMKWYLSSPVVYERLSS
jgi:hypothetical protein